MNKVIINEKNPPEQKQKWKFFFRLTSEVSGDSDQAQALLEGKMTATIPTRLIPKLAILISTLIDKIKAWLLN